MQVVKPDVPNISRYYNRPFAAASSFKDQVQGRELKKEAGFCLAFAGEISFEHNKKKLAKRTKFWLMKQARIILS